MIDATALAGTTSSVVLQSDGVDLDPVYGPNDIQFAFAVLIAVASIFLSALFLRFLSSLVLDDEEKENARAVTSALQYGDAHELRIPHDADFAEYRDRILELFRGDFEPDVPRLRAAVGRVGSEWNRRRRAAADAVRDELPALSRVLSLEAVFYLLLGAIVSEPLTRWGSLFSTTAETPDPSTTAEQLSAGVELVIDVVAAFPYAGRVYTLLFLVVLEAGSFLYEHVYLVGFAILAGAVLIWFGDRLVANDVEPRLYRSRPRAAFSWVAVVASAWVAGVAVSLSASALHSSVGAVATAVVTTFVVGAVVAVKAKRVIDASGDLIDEYRDRKAERALVVDAASEAKTLAGELEGFTVDDTESSSRILSSLRPRPTPPVREIVKSIAVVPIALVVTLVAAGSAYVLAPTTFGAAYGLLASVLAAWVVGRRELHELHDRLTTAYEQADEDGVGPTGTTTYLVGRKVFGVLGTLAAVILPLYLLNGVQTGKLVSVASIAIFESSTQVRVTGALLAVIFVVFVIVQSRPAWGDLLAALRYSLDRQGLRVALLTRGFPILAFLLAFPVVWGSPFVSSSAVALGVAAGVAISIRGFFWLKSHAEYAYATYEYEPRKPSRVWVSARVVETPVGVEIAIADLNDHRVAAPTERLDELVDQILEDTESILENVDAKPSVFEYYAERIEDGVVDFERVEDEYMGSIAKEIERRASEAGRKGIDAERLDEIMSEKYDVERYRAKLRRLQEKRDGVSIYDGRVKDT
jgi:hypothetical protein